MPATSSHHLTLAANLLASADTAYTQNTNNTTVTYFVGVVAIVSGALFLFFGRRLFKPTVYLTGFYIGAALAYIVISQYIEPRDESNAPTSWGYNRDIIYLVSCLVVGTLVAFVNSFLWRVGLFAIGAMGGAVAVVYLLQWFPQMNLISGAVGKGVFISLFALATGISALFMEHVVVIIATSAAGSYVLIFGVDCFVQSGFMQATEKLFAGEFKSFHPVDIRSFTALMIVALVLFFIGIAVQLFLTAVDVDSISPKKRVVDKEQQ